MLFTVKEYLAENTNEYEYVSEGKKTNEMNDIVKQYSTTIKAINKQVNEATRDGDYNKALKLLNDKKKIIRTIEKAVNDVEVTSWDQVKGDTGFIMWGLPSVVRVVNWSSKLGMSAGSAAGNGLSYYGLLLLAGLCAAPIGMPMVGQYIYQAYIKPNNLENLKDTAHTHPSKTNLLKVIDSAMKETDSQIKHINRLKSVKEAYISIDTALENYMNTVLENIIGK